MVKVVCDGLQNVVAVKIDPSVVDPEDVEMLEDLVRRLTSPAEKPKPRPVEPEVEAMEDRFREVLGTRVRLNPGKTGGRLTIYYYSDEELEELYNRLVK